MNRKQLQDWLNQFPEDAEIYVVVTMYSPADYLGATTRVQVFNGCDDNYCYIDYSLHGEPHKPNSSSSDRQLILGDY